jgi:rod shape-determining protein MreB
MNPLILRRVAVDLGTTNTRIAIPGRGIVIHEPSVVALDAATQTVVAIGQEAKEMLGRTPDSIVAAHPLKDGVIANYRITQAMLRYYLNRLSGPIRFVKPELMIAVPAGVTSTERRAMIDACLAAGARTATIIKSPVAAALGAGIPIAANAGHMVIDIGGGTTEVAVISLGDIVAAVSVRVGGGNMDTAIAHSVRKKHNLIIGEQTSEQVKIRIGAAQPLDKELTLEVSGSNAVTGLPESILLSSKDVTAGLKGVLSQVIAAVKSVLQKTPPELAADVMDKGMVMTGGGAELRHLDTLMSKVTGVPCEVADEPTLCVVRGTELAVEHLDAYRKSILWARQ